MFAKVWEPGTKADNCPFVPLYLPPIIKLVFILFSAGNLGIAAFREPQRHQLQYILYLLRYLPWQLSKLALQDAQACLPSPCHSLVLGHTGPAVLHAGLF